MSTRSVLVRLQANVTSFNAGMASAQRAVKDVRGEVHRTARDNAQAFNQIGTAATVAGGAIALGLGKAATAAASFDREMSAVQAVSGSSAAELDRLRQAALDAGRDTAFSAGESAQAIGELTRAGVSVTDVLDGALIGALDLAAAGGLDLADAATIAAQSLNIFKLDGDETVRVADALAAGANKSAADVTSLGDALRQGGQVAAQTGIDLETTVGTLALFADNALVGSDAGTSFKTMLQRLTPQSEEAAGLMEELGFSAFDASGQFVGLEDVAGQLQEKLGGLSDEQRNTALATLFGSDAVRAAAVLMDEGTAGVAEYTAAVTDQGAAAEMAGVMLDNLAGDIQALGGSAQNVLINFGDNMNGALRSTVQFATESINALDTVSEPMQNVILGASGIASGLSLTAGAFLLAAPRIVETRAAMSTLATQMPKTVGAMRGVSSFLTGPWGLAVAGGVALLGAFIVNEQKAAAEAETLRDALTDTGGFKADGIERLLDQLGPGAIDALDDVGLSINRVVDAAIAGPEAVGDLAREMADLGGTLPARSLNLVVNELYDLEDRMVRGQSLNEAYADAMDAAGEATEGTAVRIRNLSSVAERGGLSLDEYAVAMGRIPRENDAASQAAEELTERIERAGDALGSFTEPSAIAMGLITSMIDGDPDEDGIDTQRQPVLVGAGGERR